MTGGIDSETEHSEAIAPIEPLHPVPLSELPLWSHSIEHGGVLIAREVRNKHWKFEQLTLDAEPALALAVPLGDDEHLMYVAPEIDPLVLEPKDLQPQYGYPVRVRMEDGSIQERTIAPGDITPWVRNLLRRNGMNRRDASAVYALSSWRTSSI